MTFPSDLELARDGERLVSLTFTVTLFTDVSLASVPGAVLSCQNEFLRLCPPENLKFYLTENMRQYKPLNKRALNMLSVWLKPAAPARSTIALELKDGELTSAPKFRFRVWGQDEEPDEGETKDSRLISMAFPPEWGTERTDVMLQLVHDLCKVFPFRSGYAGYSFECSRYAAQLSQKHAWEKSLRHRGIDIFDFANESIAVDENGVKGAGWLTILDDRFIKELGGSKKVRAALPDAVEILPVTNGVVLKAGPEPQLGDTNRRKFLPEYKAVYAVTKPLVERAIGRYPPLSVGTAHPRDETQTWLRRFDDA